MIYRYVRAFICWRYAFKFKKDEKKYLEIQKFDFLGNKTVKTFFVLVQMFSSPIDYLASIMF